MMSGRDHQNETAGSRQGAGANALHTTRLGFKVLTCLLGLALVLAGLGEWGLGNRVAHSQAASEVTVFGPKTYTRTTEKPQPVLDSFTVPGTATDFTLIVQNGKEDGTQRVTSAVILLNEHLILGPPDFKRQVDVIRKAVSLQADNKLSVEVRGDPGTFFTVSIVGARLNTLPVADAGADQTARVGDRVELDGSGSSDADGEPLGFRWQLVTRPATSVATLFNASEVRPYFTVDAPGSYTVELVVNDGHEDSAPDTATLSTINSPPVANAGTDQSVDLGATVTLDGGGSTDVDGDPLTYRWTLDTAPTGSTATLANPTSRTPSFKVDKAGTYLLALVVNDGTVDSAPDYVVVTTLNSKPVADAGPDQTARVGDTVTLDGRGSSDADDNTLTYAWSFTTKPEESTAGLSDPAGSAPAFTADVAGIYVVQLVVNDGTVDSEPDTARIEVAAANQPPEITSGPVTTAIAGQLYNYRVTATDPDAGDTLTYSLPTQPEGMTIGATTGLIEWTPTESQVGGHSVRVRVEDRDGLFDEQDFVVTVAEAPPTNQAPTVDAGANQTITLPTNSVALNGTVTDDGLPNPPGAVTVNWSKDSSSTGTGTVTFGDASQEDTTATFSAAGSYVLKLTASDGEKSASDTVTITVNAEPEIPLPPDPATVAPPVDPTVATTTYAATEFLYTGSNPIQTGVAAGTIVPKRAAVVRGKVLDKANQPLSGVTITILNHPEFGQTLSRADGMFDMAVNGGSYLTVNYARAGYLSAQRQVDVPWQDYVLVDDAALVQLDAKVTTIDLTDTTQAVKVAQGNPVTDGDGSRQATILFPQGVQATMTLPDGSVQNLTTLNVRATEYTVGENGPKAMPAELPPTSGYTYAMELSADEAVAANAKTVTFSAPVPFYVENFLNMPVGIQVPTAYYDKAKSAWVPEPDGKVIKILSIVNGLAQIDTDGNGSADTGLGITDAERERLAGLYAAGTSLWRVTISHFTPYDLNYGISPAAGAQPPQPPKPKSEASEKLSGGSNPPCRVFGSIIECENQVLGEAIPVAGTAFALNYRSDRVPGRKAANTLTIPLSGATVPSVLKRIDLEIKIAGRVFRESFSGGPNQSYTFTWDGRDAMGRELQGVQRASIRIGYVYGAFYNLPPYLAASFGLNSGTLVPGNISARQDITLWQEQMAQLGAWDAQSQGVAGWTLDMHHAYDPIGRVLYRGDGTRLSSESLNAMITTVAGTTGYGYNGDNQPATSALLWQPIGPAIGPDGSIYFGDFDNHRVRRVRPDGIITTIAGTGIAGYSGDGGPATSARLNLPQGVALGPDGSVYIADSGNNRIRRIRPDGIITTVAGTGGDGYSGDGGPAVEALLSYPRDVAFGSDGSLYFADSRNLRVRRIGPDGRIATVAGMGLGPTGDGIPAMNAQLSYPRGIALGPDGSLYIAAWFDHRVRRVGPDGIITTVAGTGVAGYGGDGGPAIQAQLNQPDDVAIGLDGSLYINEMNNATVRRVAPDGTIATLAGTGIAGYAGDGGPAALARFNLPIGIGVAEDSSIYVADTYNSRIRRINATLPGFTSDNIAIPSADGKEFYQFDANGRHLRTVNVLTGAALYQFGYDAAGRLIRITDGDGNVTTIERDGSGNPTAIVAPFGQRTALALDANGYLASVTNPAGDSYQMAYSADGLLTSFRDPRGNASTISYDALGRLQRDENAAGGSQSLARTELANGYAVSRTTALNRVTTHRVEDLATGDRKRTDLRPDGTQTQTLIKTDGTRQTTSPDGTITTLVEGPDPRFGMQAPIPKSLTVQTGGLTSTVTTQRTAGLSDPNNPLSLTTLTDTVTVNGRTANSVYNAATKTSTNTSAASRISTATFDAVGRVIGAQVAGLLAVSNAYDAQGRLASTTQGSGADERRLGFAYNPEGYLDTVTDPLGRTLRYEYDGAGRVTRQILPDNREIRYGYDRNGNLTALTPPGRPAHVFQYTPVDLTQEYVPPEVGAGLNKTVYEYDLDKNLTRILRPDGAEIRFAYDSAGRLSQQTLPNGALSYGYNATTGKLTSLGDPDGGGLGFTYSGALLTQTTWTGAVSGSVGFGYDSDFRVTSVSVNGANPIAYQYDPDSLLTQAGSLTLSRSSQNGLLTGSTLGQVSDSYAYSGFGEVDQYDAKSSGTSFFKTDYTYDKLGRITRRVETLGASANTYDYTYDLAGRLQEVKLNGGTVSSYGYDDNGNRLSGPGLSVAPTYDDQDRLLSYGGATYTYTANGELKTKAVGVQTTTYDYDVLGNLRKVTLPDGRTLDYVIDAANRRTGKKVDGVLVQGFLYQDPLKPVAELDGSGNVVSRFVYATRVNVPDYLVKGSITYRIVTDHLGSPRFVVNSANGTLVQRMDYDEFGNVTGDTNPGFQPFGFAGGLYDRDTKLVRFGARDYDPETGRWTAKDPILFAGRDTNLYGYVVNDPVNEVDSYGLKSNSCEKPSKKPNWIEKIKLGKCFGPLLDCYEGIPGGTTYKQLWPWDKGAYNHDIRLRKRELRTGKGWEDTDLEAVGIHSRLIYDSTIGAFLDMVKIPIPKSWNLFEGVRFVQPFPIRQESRQESGSNSDQLDDWSPSQTVLWHWMY